MKVRRSFEKGEEKLFVVYVSELSVPTRYRLEEKNG
jgi:hypothetical protein